MAYVFGPVPSRRLGQSLGVDTIPLKTCNWNCVYCQLGRTVPLTNERREYYPTQEIIREVSEALSRHRSGEIDWITFVGSGEPTLHSKIGLLIREVKGLSSLPVAVITNGALLYLPELREELLAADAVLPSLDAGTPELYKRINRPHPDVAFSRYLDGLVEFAKVYSGKLWVEVMLVRGLNDTETALEAIASALRKIKPDQVHINLPTRPPVETWVEPPDETGLLRAQAILGEVAQVVHPALGEFDLSGCETVMDGVIAIITRHPMREDELIQALQRWAPDDVRRTLVDLAASGRAREIERFGTRFWSAHGAVYPQAIQSERTRLEPGERRKGEARLTEEVE